MAFLVLTLGYYFELVPIRHVDGVSVPNSFLSNIVDLGMWNV